MAVNFIGKVAILGNIAGTRVFEVVNKETNYQNQNPGYRYTTVQHANIMNTVRGNVAQLVRNRGNNIDIDQGVNFMYQDSRN